MAIVGDDCLAVDRLAVPEIESLLKLCDRKNVLSMRVGCAGLRTHAVVPDARLPLAHLNPGLRLPRVRHTGRRHRHLEPQSALESSREGVAIARDRAAGKPLEVGVTHGVGSEVGEPAVGACGGSEPGTASLGKGLLAPLDPVREEQVASKPFLAVGVLVGELPVAA